MPEFYKGQSNYIDKFNTLATEAEINAVASGLSTVNTKVAAAAASATTASTQATAATNSATTATARASTAITQAAIASTQATAATNSATTATTRATTASTQATAATNSATTATARATTASTQATAATNSATTATTQAGIASTQATAATNSKTTATTQAAIASTQATQATASATTAIQRASTAATQATLAQAWATQLATPVSGGEYSAKYWAQYIASTFSGVLIYRGTWSAASGVYPGSPAIGDYWKVSVAGTVSSIAYEVNDSIIYNGTTWDKIDTTDAVTSVAGRTGVVVVTKADVGLGNVDNTTDLAKPISTAAQNALNLKATPVSPSFTTPNLGTPSAGNLINVTGYPLANMAGVLPLARQGTGVSTGTGSGSVVLNTSPTFAGSLTAGTVEGLKIATNNYPVVSPSLFLDFVYSQGLDPRITFTRASTATYTDNAGLINYSPVNSPRFDYSASTLLPQGLLFEEPRTNLLLYSSEFDNAVWTKVNCNININSITSPNGNIDADKIIESTISQSTVREDTTISAGATLTFSIYAKAGERSNIRLQFSDLAIANQTMAFFNLSSGTISGLSQTGTSTLGTASIVPAGNGWYRCILTGCIDTSSTTARCRITLSDASNNILYTNDGISGLYIWGAQLETGSAVTTYVPSTNTFTSRASIASYFDSLGVLQSAAINTARSNYNPANLTRAPYLLLEESRTNSVRNSTGAITALNTLPLNWVPTGIGGINYTVTGTGTESGIPYTDIKISGTPTVNSFAGIVFDTTIAGTTGQTWTGSIWAKLIAGSFTNSSNISEIREVDSGLVFLTNTTATMGLTGSLTRYTLTRTLANASTAFVQFRIAFQVTTSLPIDFTIRVGLPQLELGYGATSAIINSPTFTSRASAATYYNASGLVTSAATNVARYTYNPSITTSTPLLYLESASTNLLQYSHNFENNYWLKAQLNIIVNATTAPDGSLGAAKLIEDTSNTQHLMYAARTATNETVTFSIYAKAAERTKIIIQISNFLNDSAQSIFDLSTATISGISANSADYTNTTPSITSVGNGWYRCVLTTTKGSVNTNSNPTVSTFTTTGIYTGDGVSGVYLWGAQLELGSVATSYIPTINTFTSRASTASYFDGTGVLQSAAINVARNTYNPANLTAAPTLLLESTRTNSIRNNTGVGAIPGTPGTQPTNWVGLGLTYNGLLYSTAGTGIEDGISYVDINVSGTFTGTPGATSATPQLEFGNIIAASLGQAWTFSAYLKLVSGSLTGVELTYRIRENNSLGGAVTSTTGSAISVSTGSLKNQRSNFITTIIDATTAYIAPQIRFVYSIAQAYNFTLRIGLPQLEQGYGATSPISTSTTAITRAADVSTSAQTTRAADVYSQAALTRAADVSTSAQATRAADFAYVNTLTPWYNPVEGTFYTESKATATLPAVNYGGIIGLNYYPNDIVFAYNPLNYFGLFVRNNLVTQADLTTLGTVNTVVKLAATLKDNDFAQSYNGSAVTTDTSGTIPTITTGLQLGGAFTNGTKGTQYIRRIAYYPRRLSNTELQTITS